MSQAVVPVVRALLLALALLLSACPAWAGIVPSFGGSQFLKFIQDSLPDANWHGFKDAEIDSLVAGVKDTTNFGGNATVAAGSATAPSNRRKKFLMSFVPGAYLPADAVVDSSKLILFKNSVNSADSMFAAILLKPWVEGTGEGAATDSTGVCWKYVSRNAVGDATQRDTTWTLPGADSVMALSARSVGTPEELAYAGALNYLTVNLNTKQDRGPYQYIGRFVSGSGGVPDTFNVTLQTRFILNSPYAAANNGFIFKTGSSDVTASGKSNTWDSSDNSDHTVRPQWLVWYHRTSQPIQIGGGE